MEHHIQTFYEEKETISDRFASSSINLNLQLAAYFLESIHREQNVETIIHACPVDVLHRYVKNHTYVYRKTAICKATRRDRTTHA
jgi:hypothetical protein